MNKIIFKKLIIRSSKIISATLLTLNLNFQFGDHTLPSEKINLPICSLETSNKCQESEMCNSDQKPLETLEGKPEDLIHANSEEAITQVD